ncbi:hypothetical protein ACFO1B_48740 [Dactylosporangium siamense]|uniref:Uncharacterized protein n=1 Tax=Dactylosporangium siamense TaxID=685454 RepID=A0A919PXL9_9ACTN|nr:hypothetical protein [Dactylosporangium siamense]GIG52177.1 hypothetical protein Dsi01nite_102180 [Dactylosporangium siamense]
MAPSLAYFVWLASGRKYTLIRPAAALQRILRGHGLTVYDFPDDDHLRASTPEDHTPFSATGWPGKSAAGFGHALDVMPRTDSAKGRAENAAIARQLIKDRDAGRSGVLWIKYINWTDEQGVCRQERWMPNRTTRSSTDKGHVHISGRSDCDDDSRADSYDPLSEGDPFMALTEQQQADLWEWVALLVDPGTPANGRGTDRFHFPPPFKALANRLSTIEGALAASALREQDMLAALGALAVGGTNIDTAAIIAAVNARSSDVIGLINEQSARIAELEAELEAVRQARHAAAQAEAVATADGPVG